jgi:AcrR family transcriptional regulator
VSNHLSIVPRSKTISDDQILEAARELFLARGFGASTLVIAKRAGISEALIFRRFGTKEALFAQALGLGETPAWIQQIDTLAGGGDAKKNLIRISLDILAHYDTQLPRLMMIWSSRTRAPMRRQLQKPPPLRILKALTRYFEREIALGRVRRGDPEVVARALLGALLNHAFYRMIGVHVRRPISARRYVTGLVDVLWNGLEPLQTAGADR